MRNKSISAVMLVVIVAWAEMALAPMLVAHSHRMHSIADDQIAPAAHVCCPGPKNQNTFFLSVSRGMACSGPNNCCFQQGPHSIPAPVRSPNEGSKALSNALTVVVRPSSEESQFFALSAISSNTAGTRLGMVLRV